MLAALLPQHPASKRKLLAIIFASMIGCSVEAVSAGTEAKLKPESTEWKLGEPFKESKKARKNLSGAACVPTTPRFTSCLIANDENTYAQFFSIEGNVLVPKDLTLLSDEKKNPDAEGVAYADGFFYVTGSHGRSRKGNKKNKTSYAVFRFAVNPATGIPRIETSESKVAGIEFTSRLRDALRDDDAINAYFDKKLSKGGINIEGIAVANGRMHFGLRGPSEEKQAFILSVDADALFTKDDKLRRQVTSLKLGKDTGIRDLAAISDGILILAGPTREEKVPYSVWFWDGNRTMAKQLAILDLSTVPKGAKAEIQLPLEEGSSEIRALVMFDGVENGGARSFRIPR
jgi:hypothetical protein